MSGASSKGKSIKDISGLLGPSGLSGPNILAKILTKIRDPPHHRKIYTVLALTQKLIF